MLYLEDTYRFETKAKIVKCGEDYIVLDQTIFYPQGGGQPFDCGKIETPNGEIQIHAVRFIDNEIRHFGSINEDWDQTKVLCTIDRERRLLNARYHTTGHLLANIIENIYASLTPTKCHAFPGESYVEFQCDSTTYDLEGVRKRLDDDIHTGLATKIFEINRNLFEKKYYKLPCAVDDDKDFRVLQIADYKPIPCGGTHLNNTQEIGSAIIKKSKIKNNILKVSYEVQSL
ncbi:MAG: alanyl-tRNA editing protein [Puniceicoccales bacterium]|nr:alanyl-tRNA editing protein [Puniceicoccales bacterium]